MPKSCLCSVLPENQAPVRSPKLDSKNGGTQINLGQCSVVLMDWFWSVISFFLLDLTNTDLDKSLRTLRFQASGKIGSSPKYYSMTGSLSLSSIKTASCSALGPFCLRYSLMTWWLGVCEKWDPHVSHNHNDLLKLIQVVSTEWLN